MQNKATSGGMIAINEREINVDAQQSDEKKLLLLLDELNVSKEKEQEKIKSLLTKIEQKQGDNSTFNKCLQESTRLAEEIEAAARKKAEEILKDAETEAAAIGSKVRLAEEEIEALREELTRHEKLDQNKSSAPYYSICNKDTAADGDDQDGSPYSMHLVAFVNARHFVNLGNVSGPVHSHSWQVKLEVEIPETEHDVVEFATIYREINSTLIPFENTVLNEKFPFNIIQPTTENISMYFFNILQSSLKRIDLKLIKLILWETPTRGIEVTKYNKEFDDLSEKDFIAKDVLGGLNEAAISTNIESAENPPDKVAESREKRIIKTYILRPPYLLRHYLIAAFVMSIFAVVVYHNILWPAAEQYYPWGSDTWGHLYKAENLYQQILNGNYYPQFTEYWYNGSQPFRYWAPLPYYVLALLRFLSGNIFMAGNYFIFICSLLGGVSWLFMSRRMGIWAASMAGIVWIVWQDNVRVAFSEGNLPRVLATSLLPLVVYLFLNVIEKKKSYINIVSLAAFINLTILCHAMIGAIYCISLMVFGFFVWVFRGCKLFDLIRGGLALIVGILASGWWLIPSMKGGITGIDSSAVREVIQFVPSIISFNPFYRFSNVEIFYWGISLILAAVISIVTWKSKPVWAKSMMVCGIILIIITFPLLRAIYVILPLAHLLWPLRFSSFAINAMLAGSLTFNLPEQRQGWLKNRTKAGLVVVALFSCLLIDSLISIPLLVHTGAQPFHLVQISNYIQHNPGWRVATIDLSQLGSAPSFTFSNNFGLEQVFGWAWQGAVTSRNIMLLNTGIEHQYYPFLLRSCVELGATDLVVKDDVIDDMTAFKEAAQNAQYSLIKKYNNLSLWRSVDRPYIIDRQTDCLVIGRYAGTVALQFPGVEMGISPYIDTYTLDHLQRYSKLIISGGTWLSKTKAENLIKDYVSSGGQVFIELSGMPENVLAKQPEFLDVYGEPVTLSGIVDIWGENQRFSISFTAQKEEEQWKAYIPMGLDHVDLQFSYYGNPAAISGYKIIDGHKVNFIGGNLTYNAFITGDSVGQKLLKNMLGLETQYYPSRIIPLNSYQSNENGYILDYSLAEDTNVVIPISALEGIRVRLDGKDTAWSNYENLLRLDLPAGTHRIHILIEKTPIYKVGFIISVISILLLLIWFIVLKRTGDEH